MERGHSADLAFATADALGEGPLWHAGKQRLYWVDLLKRLLRGDPDSGRLCKIGTAQQAAEFGDVVIVAIPLYAIESIAAAPLAGKVVLDADNYYPDRDGRIEALDERQTTTSEMLAQHLAGAKVVKAFNAILQGDLAKDARPAGAPCAADRR